jgi:hypothetical protein
VLFRRPRSGVALVPPPGQLGDPRSPIHTSAPSPTSLAAKAAPIPDAPPVTNATFPAKVDLIGRRVFNRTQWWIRFHAFASSAVPALCVLPTRGSGTRPLVGHHSIGRLDGCGRTGRMCRCESPTLGSSQQRRGTAVRRSAAWRRRLRSWRVCQLPGRVGRASSLRVSSRYGFDAPARCGVRRIAGPRLPFAQIFADKFGDVEFGTGQ